jgi:hypothetical protein
LTDTDAFGAAGSGSTVDCGLGIIVGVGDAVVARAPASVASGAEGNVPMEEHAVVDTRSAEVTEMSRRVFT